MLVGTSRCTQVCTFEDGILHLWKSGLGEQGGFKKTVRGGQPVGLPNSRGNCMRVGQLSCYSQGLLLPLRVPPMPALACST